MMEKHCEVCGNALAGRQTRYCSKPCAIKANTVARAADPERMERHKASKAQWKRDNPDRVKASNSRREMRYCEWCGRQYEVRPRTPSRCCSPSCGSYYEGASSPIPWRACATCGGRYLRHSGCTCLGASRVPWATCVCCGQRFVFRTGGFPRCQSCTDERPSKHWKISKTRRAALYARDEYTCQICGERVDVTADPISDWYPSLDHIIPRVHGGKHGDDNLRLAHRWCNSVISHGAYHTDDDLRMCVSTA